MADPWIDLSHLPEVLSRADVAALFGVDPATVTRWADGGRLDSFRTPGGHRRFWRDAISAAIQRDHVPAKRESEAGR
jgi:excisionase family DNA binding protein